MARPKQTKPKAKPRPKKSTPAGKPKPDRPKKSTAEKPKKPKTARKRKLLHEPVPHAPLEIRDALGAAARPVIAAHGSHLALCVDNRLELYIEDTPQRAVLVDPTIVAVARSASRSAAIDQRGVLHLVDDNGNAVASLPVGSGPRSLVATPDGRFVALVDSGLVIVDGAGALVARVEFPAPLAAACDPRGSMVIVAEDHRLAEWTGRELVDIPPSAEQLVSIAALGENRFLCVGQSHWFLLDLAERELESIAQASLSPHIAAVSDRIAWVTGESLVRVGAIERGAVVVHHHMTYPSTFGRVRMVLDMFTTIEPIDEPLSVTGIAFLDRDHLAIALVGGRGNIIDLRADPKVAARKLDEHEGSTITSWKFDYDGQSLIAP